MRPAPRPSPPVVVAAPPVLRPSTAVAVPATPSPPPTLTTTLASGFTGEHSLVYSGLTGILLACTGMLMVTRRRRHW
ncbi:MAG TPA: LPXTG cell wall anchor domain-containing protein [Pilimelia sp.]|nr:LPXTG cell wall anchor domain-containing protein [Pilimelia sp.]